MAEDEMDRLPNDYKHTEKHTELRQIWSLTNDQYEENKKESRHISTKNYKGKKT